MKNKVYIANPIPKYVEEYIGKYCEYQIWNGDSKITRDKLLENVKDVDGLIVFGHKIDEELLSAAPKLKVVSNLSVGYDNFNIEEMKKRGVVGTNTPYVLDDTVADLIFALILATSRRVVELDKYVRQGNWEKDIEKTHFGLDVHGATLGIIGMGNIGEAVATRGKFGFGMDILYHNRTRKPQAEKELGAKYCSLEEVLRKSDFIVLMTPLTEDTKELIGYKEFDMMKETAIFINGSRGQTVNEEALINALSNKKIFGAGLDVFYKEPVDVNNPLLKMDNVVVLPHIGSATGKTRDEMAMLAAENMVKALKGEMPPTMVKEFKK
ncbi:2-hydroxyacid dehydrogenase [Clostridium sp. UBA4548]|uniref:2-hydroxyacid dehydrogenase n=1 Tax=Clostridium sp. UBA4548 TaxID=1946361 RepID=UPI0025C49B91|nr:D-glycerate dehydrogenase [Clostridium sp. UBA4548]